MKKVLIGVAILIVVIVGAVIYLGSNLDSIVKAGVEKYGPRYTGTQVRLGSVDSSLLGGEVTIKDFFLGNPKGFKTSHAFKVKSVHVAVDTDSLMSDVIHIKEITIDSPDIIYEMGNGSSNLQAIQKNVNQAAGGGGKAPSSSQTTSQSSGGKKVIIDNLYVRNAKATVTADMLGGKVVPLPVPDLHLTDIGKKSNGTSMAEASKQVLDAITGSITNAVGKLGLKGMTEGAQKMMEGAGQGTSDTMKNMEDKLKGLFGK